MLQLAWLDGKGNFLDPMCGSGTLLIEANARNISPATDFRKKFMFQNWKIMTLNCLPKSKNLESIELKNLQEKLWVTTLMQGMLNAARINIEAAEMEDVIEVKNKISLNLKRYVPIVDGFQSPYDERITINQP